MKIGIIGAGFIGRAVARLAVGQGYQVMVSNSRGPETLGSTTVSLGCKAGTVADAAAFGHLILVAIPFKSYSSIPVEPLAGKIVMDANNYYPQRDGEFTELDQRRITTSELLARHLASANIVKAFNAILERDIEKHARPHGTAQRRALPIAGDDATAKRMVAEFHDALGYDTVDAGALSEGWRFERAKPAYCIPLDAASLREALAAAQRAVDLPHGSWR